MPLLQDFLIASAADRPDHVALVTKHGRQTYREILREATSLAWALVDRHVAPGDRVVILGENDAPTCIAFFGALLANAVPVVVSPHSREKKLAFILGDCRPSALIGPSHLGGSFLRPAAASSDLRTSIVWGPIDPRLLARLRRGTTWDGVIAERLGEAPPRRRIDVDLASIIYTSGSTGDSKGVMQTHRSMRTAAISIGSYLENREDDIIFSALPLPFDYGLYQMLMAFAASARLVLETSFALTAHALRRVAEEKATAFPGVPTMFALLDGLEADDAVTDLQSVRYVTNTAAPLARRHVDVIRSLFPRARVYSMYGLTECKRVSYLPPKDIDRKPGSVGIAIPNTEVWVLGHDGTPVTPGIVGEVVVRGGTLMAGYWGNAQATERVLRPGPLPGERVLYTGDYAVVDDEGYLYVLGRRDDVMKCGGEKVAPREVEDALLDIPGIRQAVVVAMPDAILGQAPKAYVVPSPGTTLDVREVLRECRKRLEPHMVPKEIVVRDELPMTATGKVSKRELEPSESTGR